MLLLRLTGSERSRGALSAPASRSGLAHLHRYIFACHAACASIRIIHVMQQRVHAKNCMPHASVLLERLLPGRAGAEISRVCNRYARGLDGMLHARQTCHEELCAHDNMGYGNSRENAASLSENRRNRLFSESDTQSSSALHGACK